MWLRPRNSPASSAASLPASRSTSPSGATASRRCVKVDLGELPGADKQAALQDDSKAPAQADQLADLGLTVTPADDGKGLVVTDVDPDSDAAERGLQAGDVIINVNSKPVAGAGDVAKAMADAAKAGRKAVLVQVTRDDTSRFVTLPVAKG